MNLPLKSSTWLLALAAALAITISSPTSADENQSSQPAYELKSVSQDYLSKTATNSPDAELFPRLATDRQKRLSAFIRALYDDFSMIASWSGQPTQCRVSRFASREPAELEGVLYKELLSNDAGLRVDVSITRRATAGDTPPASPNSPADAASAGRPLVEVQLADEPEANQWAEEPASLLVEASNSLYGDRYRVARITSFDVNCTSPDWSSSHRASVFWLREPNSGRLAKAKLQDPVLDVTTTIRQAAQQLRLLEIVASQDQNASLDKFGECIERQALSEQSLTNRDFRGSSRARVFFCPRTYLQAVLDENSDYLLVAYPEHPKNSRHTAPPSLSIDRSKRLDVEGAGRFVISAFFEPDGLLRRVRLVEILDGFEQFQNAQGGYSEEGFFAFGRAVSNDLFEILHVERHGKKQHAADVTAVVSVTSDGQVQLDDYFAYIPKCCCGGSFCQ